ncbi:hypothetical protein [Myxosarcina sp. GI1]|uniref:hypothetical protein n=1 Tax=Myxosarcina sp. GI1 TaxID=1541065 RepID=UPI0005632425|nr:hypothetical protein [Myxosarcina sp. GI1]
MGDLLGAVAGPLVACIIYIITSGKPDFISYDIYAMLYVFIGFLVCLIVGIVVGAVKSGIERLD